MTLTAFPLQANVKAETDPHGYNTTLAARYMNRMKDYLLSYVCTLLYPLRGIKSLSLSTSQLLL
jgi:hypothetical protein